MLKVAVRNYISHALQRRVRTLLKRNQVVVIAVVGSIGKTSTKLAIAQSLSTQYRVQYQTGNYNLPLTVPLVLFGLELPGLLNPIGWIQAFWSIHQQLWRPYPYDIVVVELGTDGPGQLQDFSGWLPVDIGVLTAISPEHMQNFKTIAAVAAEELTIRKLASRVVINYDLVDAQYLPAKADRVTYSLQNADADYYLAKRAITAEGCTAELHYHRQPIAELVIDGPSNAQHYSALAAAAVCDIMQVQHSTIPGAIRKIQAVPGRMQLLRGINNYTIIDDTYNASPDAVKGALQSLYAMYAPAKIALLGSMNELGSMSPSAHAEIGALCDPTRLNLVVTLGADANTYLAPIAEKQGCEVVRCTTPRQAADAIKQRTTANAIILAKGSQNGVFAEEAVKLLLANPADAIKLVRQSPAWHKQKQKALKNLEA